MKTELDMIVIGGGMIGAATALGLAKQGLRLALLEKNPLPTFNPDSDYDLRISAISMGSIQLLEKLGVWEQIVAMRSTPYTQLETWEIDGFNTLFRQLIWVWKSSAIWSKTTLFKLRYGSN